MASAPIPAYSPNVPIISKSGGDPDAYNDPNSPESIVKKTAEMNAQVAVDSMYDVKTNNFHENKPIKESFSNYDTSTSVNTIIVLITLLLLILFMNKNLKRQAKLYIIFVASVFIILVIRMHIRDG